MSDEEKKKLPVLVSESDALVAFRDLGFAEVSPRQLDALRKLGLHIREEGVLTHQRGTAMFAQHALMEAISGVKQMLSNEITHSLSNSHKDSKAKRYGWVEQLTKILTLLIGKLTDSQELMIKLEGGTPAIQSGALPDKLAKSFAPGAEVKPRIHVTAQNVQIVEGQKGLIKPAEGPKSAP